MSHIAKAATVNPAMPSASAFTETATNGAIVPAVTPDTPNCTKPCSDDAMPRNVGKRSSNMIVTDGGTRLLPQVKTKIGSTLHGTPGATSQHSARLSATPANIIA